MNRPENNLIESLGLTLTNLLVSTVSMMFVSISILAIVCAIAVARVDIILQQIGG